MKKELLALLAIPVLAVCIYAASPGFSSFDQTYFTTNNLIVGFRSNGVPVITVSNINVTNITVYSNLYVTTNVTINTNITINGTNVTTYTDLVWTNDNSISGGGAYGRVAVRPEVNYRYVYPSNLYNLGWRAISPTIRSLSAGTNQLNASIASSFLLFSADANPANTILSLSSGDPFGHELYLMGFTNLAGGTFTLPANSALYNYAGVVKLNNDQDWIGGEGAVLQLMWVNPDWWEVGRWTAGTNMTSVTTNVFNEIYITKGGKTTIVNTTYITIDGTNVATINPTDTYIPYRYNTNTFLDSPFFVSTNRPVTQTAILVGTNTQDYAAPAAADAYALYSVRDQATGEPGSNGVFIKAYNGGSGVNETDFEGAAVAGIAADMAVSAIGAAFNYGVKDQATVSGLAESEWTRSGERYALISPFQGVGGGTLPPYQFSTLSDWTGYDVFTITNAGTKIFGFGPNAAGNAQILFGDGGTNALYRSGRDLIYTNDAGGNTVRFYVNDAWFGTDGTTVYVAGGSTYARLQRLDGLGIIVTAAGGGGLTPSGSGIPIGGETTDPKWEGGSITTTTRPLYIVGFQPDGTALTDISRVAIEHTGTNGAVVFDSQSAGTAGTPRPFVFTNSSVYFSSAQQLGYPAYSQPPHGYFTNVYNTNLPSGNNDLFTVPAGKRFMLWLSSLVTTNATTTTFYNYVKTNGNYYRSGSAINVTTNVASSSSSVLLFEPGEIVACNTDQVGVNVVTSGVLFDSSSPLSSHRITTIAAADNTVLTVGAGKTFHPYILSGGFISATQWWYFNGSGGPVVVKHYIVPSGGSVSESTLVKTTTVSDGSSIAIVIPPLTAGSTLVLNSDSASANQMNVVIGGEF